MKGGAIELEMMADRLYSNEVEGTKDAISELSSVLWATPVLARLERAGGIKSENMPLMFEVRYARELFRAGASAQYEFAAGEGKSTVEFRLNTQPAWLIELVSVRTSDSARRATREIRPLFYEQLLRATEDEPGRGAEGEMITAQQKIGEKVFSRGGPTKFPSLDGSLRLILVDIRGYLDEGGDHWDYYEMANGRRALPAESREFLGHFWKNREGKVEPIKGLFERGNPLAAAQYMRERIHFIGFIRERSFRAGEIRDWSLLLPNPELLSSTADQLAAYRSYPLACEGKTTSEARRR